MGYAIEEYIYPTPDCLLAAIIAGVSYPIFWYVMWAILSWNVKYNWKYLTFWSVFLGLNFAIVFGWLGFTLYCGAYLLWGLNHDHRVGSLNWGD